MKAQASVPSKETWSARHSIFEFKRVSEDGITCDVHIELEGEASREIFPVVSLGGGGAKPSQGSTQRMN